MTSVFLVHSLNKHCLVSMPTNMYCYVTYRQLNATSVPLQSLQRNGVPLLAMTPPHLILNRYSGHMRSDIA